MGEVVRFRTESVDPQDRLAVWGETIWSKLGGLEARTLGREAFDASVVASELGSALVCDIAVGPHRIDRTYKLIRECDPELLKIVFQLKGQVCLEQRDQRLVLNPGDWCVYEGSRPYTLFNTMAAEQVALLIPRQALASRTGDASACMARAFEVSRGAAQILRQCLMSTLSELDALAEPARRDLGDALIDLAKLALLEKAGRAPCSGKQMMRERVKAYIRRNVADSGLSVEGISRHFNCTTRYLHKIFDGEGTTLSRFIWNTRLERCCAELVGAAAVGRSITEIAFQWGFSNSAHFSRAFRERFGTSPRRYRAEQTGGLAS